MPQGGCNVQPSLRPWGGLLIRERCQPLLGTWKCRSLGPTPHLNQLLGKRGNPSAPSSVRTSHLHLGVLNLDMVRFSGGLVKQHVFRQKGWSGPCDSTFLSRSQVLRVPGPHFELQSPEELDMDGNGPRPHPCCATSSEQSFRELSQNSASLVRGVDAATHLCSGLPPRGQLCRGLGREGNMPWITS